MKHTALTFKRNLTLALKESKAKVKDMTAGDKLMTAVGASITVRARRYLTI